MVRDYSGIVRTSIHSQGEVFPSTMFLDDAASNLAVGLLTTPEKFECPMAVSLFALGSAQIVAATGVKQRSKTIKTTEQQSVCDDVTVCAMRSSSLASCSRSFFSSSMIFHDGSRGRV